LVSVRNAEEALAALAGGADIVDVKEPAQGSLGAASAAAITAVLHAVDGRAPVTAAAGELMDLLRAKHAALPEGLALCKIGLAGCRDLPDWRAHWRDIVAALAPCAEPFKHSVAVVYADWRASRAPEPRDVLQLGADAGSPALLIDTFDKSAGSLFDIWPIESLRAFLDEVRKHDIMTVLAGSLTLNSIATAGDFEPDLVAVRTAACEEGRNSAISRQRVESLRRMLITLAPASSSADAQTLRV
jgi:uncharacterized protein (UPF0264 family)